jgi:hypothetical protein
VLRIDFSTEERKKYVLLEKEAKGLLEKMNHGEKNGYSFVLELLLRMRQFSVPPIPPLRISFPGPISQATFPILLEICFFRPDLMYRTTGRCVRNVWRR